MVAWLNQKAVKKGAGQGNPITLGRIAKAYAPVVLAVRAKLGDRIRVQVDTRTPTVQCDIAFLGYDRTNLCRDSADYVEKFGLIITKANPVNAKLTDDEVLRRNRGFSEIARRGLEGDAKLKDLLNKDNIPSIADSMKQLHVKRPAVPARPAPAGAATSGN
jgi:hypothetical protein